MAGFAKNKSQQEAEQAWKQLQTVLHPDILQAPRLDWSQVDPLNIRYLHNEVQETPWLNHLTFMIGILTCHTRQDRHTISSKMYNLHARWRVLFPRYAISSFVQWNPADHIPRYLADSELSDTFQTRQSFLENYNTCTRHIDAYLRSLPGTEQENYQLWALPILPPDQFRRLSRAGEVTADQQQRRKEETDALVPHFSRIRGEAHLRWNQLRRLREKFRQAIAAFESKQAILPLTFSYEEQRLGQRLHFRLWDRYSFIEKHIEQYGSGAKKDYRLKVRGFAPKNNHFFLEILYTEHLKDSTHDTDALFWWN